MASQVMRITLKAYDHQLVDASAKKIIETVKKNGAQVSGPVPLPTKKEVVTILRAVHKYKDSREQFEQRTHKRLIDIITPTQKTVDALSRLEMPAGVYIDIKMKNKYPSARMNTFVFRCREIRRKRNEESYFSTKVGMTQMFNEDGVLTPVTVLQAGPCVVTQVKTVENDGYSAVQVGFTDKREKLVNKAQKGHFNKAGVSYKRYVREFRFEDAESYALAQEIKADIFAAGDKIDATAISKGKGFQGAIKRHGQHRGPMAHGSKFHRHAGSNGACSDPSKVFKGKGMPGQMGHKKITIQNLEVVRVDAEKNLLLVKGAVPGPKKSLVTIKETVKVSK